MLVVVAGDVLVGDVDFGRDFLVQDLIDSDGAADIALEIRESDLLVLQPLIELLLGEGRFVLVKLAVNLFVSGEQTQLFRAAHEDLVIDHLVQNI